MLWLCAHTMVAAECFVRWASAAELMMRRAYVVVMRLASSGTRRFTVCVGSAGATGGARVSGMCVTSEFFFFTIGWEYR